MDTKQLNRIKQIQASWQAMESSLKELPNVDKIFPSLDVVSAGIAEFSNSLEKEYQTIISDITGHGCKLRTGHKLVDHSKTATLDKFIYIICRQDRPAISHAISDFEDTVNFWEKPSQVIYVFAEDGSLFKKDWILGHGKTERDAWEMAVMNWQEQSKRSEVLW
jgi:hypothetical protein